MEEKLRKIEPDEIGTLNPKRESLTIDKLKELTGWNDLTDEQAQEIIFAIKSFVGILVGYQTERDQKENNETEYNLKQAA
jgi:hypothetical protein